MKKGYVYILTNDWHTTFYVGVTSDIAKRISQHLEGTGDSFTHRYHLRKPVLIETWDDIQSAIQREKQIKAGSRASKIRLIERQNPEWKDLIYLIQ